MDGEEVGKRGEIKNPENGRRKRWGVRDRINIKNKRRSLGPEWSMS